MSGLECQTCGAALTIEPNHRTGRCLYCASPAVIDRPADPNRPNPTFALGFVVPEKKALAIARRWVRRPFFAPGAFRSAKVNDIRGIYVPTYLYTAAAHSSFSASIGENYTVTETYTTTDANGKTVTRTRTKTKTEWRSLSGTHAIYVSDHVVTASRGLANADLARIEPFDLRALHRYSAKLVSGWVAEEPSMSADESLAHARGEALRSLGGELGRFMPGDRHRNLQYQTRFHNEDLELTLLPVWVLPVRYAEDKPVVRLLVNGQTGRIWGRAPTSAVKVTLAILIPLLLLLLVGMVAYLVGGA
ncbi:MAG: hypothetical protein AAGF12_18535 [Myxococcota bacterium]